MKWGVTDAQREPGEWLVREDGDAGVVEGMVIEGDSVHLGWSLRLTVDGGVPLPVAEAVLAAATAALVSAIDGLEVMHEGEPFTFGTGD